MKFINLSAMAIGAANRKTDKKIKAQLKLKYLGLLYVRNDYRAEPKQIFESQVDKLIYVRKRMGEYIQLTEDAANFLTEEEIADAKENAKLV